MPLGQAAAGLKGSNCLKCGTAVEPGAAYCVACSDATGRPPDFEFNVKPQKRPPYESTQETDQ